MKRTTKGIKNTEDFNKRLIEYFGNKYDILKGDYINRDSIFTVKCKDCNYERTTSARMIINSNHCPGCIGLGKYTTNTYKEKVFDLVGNEYTVLGNYIGGTKNILIRHNKCGYSWNVIAKNFVRKNHPTRCPKCNCNLIDNNEFLNRFNKLANSNNFSILNEVKNCKSTVKLLCNKCNTVYTRKAGDILRSNFIKCYSCDPSLGIFKIINFLRNNNFNYSLEAFFSNFKSINGNNFKYDVFIKRYNLLIEYDGEQHFEESNKRFNKMVRNRDLVKNYKILLSKKYSLLRISYKELNIIDDILYDILINKSSTTIRNNNLLFISRLSNKNFNLESYYYARSTFKQMEMENIEKYNFFNEDIVSSFMET